MQVKPNTEMVTPYTSTKYISILVINCKLYKPYHKFKRKSQTQHNKQYTAKSKEVPLTTINITFIHIKKTTKDVQYFCQILLSNLKP